MTILSAIFDKSRFISDTDVNNYLVVKSWNPL